MVQFNIRARVKELVDSADDDFLKGILHLLEIRVDPRYAEILGYSGSGKPVHASEFAAAAERGITEEDIRNSISAEDHIRELRELRNQNK